MQRLRIALIGCWLGLGLWAIAPINVVAQAQEYLASNQGMEQAASLVAPEPEMKINIYPRPGTRQSPIGYGVDGDAVMVLEQTGSNAGTVWNRIRFEAAPDAEGWVQLEYLSLQSGEQQLQGNQNPSNQSGGYLGDRSAPQSGSRQSYSQTEPSSRYQQGQRQYNR